MSDVTRQLIEQKAEQARAITKTLAADLERARRDEQAWARLLNASRRRLRATLVSVLREYCDTFSYMRDNNETQARLIKSLYQESCEQATKTARQFAALFPRACSAADITLDSTSRHPKYSIREFIHTTVDDRALQATITIRDAGSSIVPLDIDPIVIQLRQEVDRLFDTQRDPERLLDRIRTAYEAILRVEQRPPGYALPLRRVANRLSKNWTHFRYDEFNVDLGNIARSRGTTINGYRLRLDQTRDTRQGMLLYGLERSGYIGFVSFKPEAH